MSLECGVFHTRYESDMGLRPRTAQRIRLAAFAVFVLAYPFVASPYWLDLANQVAIATVGAIGLNILVGYTGQISLGQGAFMAIGAYCAGLLTLNFGVPWGREHLLRLHRHRRRGHLLRTALPAAEGALPGYRHPGRAGDRGVGDDPLDRGHGRDRCRRPARSSPLRPPPQQQLQLLLAGGAHGGRNRALHGQPLPQPHRRASRRSGTRTSRRASSGWTSSAPSCWPSRLRRSSSGSRGR